MVGWGPGGARKAGRVAGALVLALLVSVLTLAGSASALPSNCQQVSFTVTCTFSFTGAEQSFVVPSGVTEVSVAAVGAQGATHPYEGAGGVGGTASADVAVTPGSTLYVEVGGSGNGDSTQSAGGWNGGGGGGTNAYCCGGNGNGGGGASDVRTVSCALDCAAGGDADSLASRLVVAGGGGGGGNPNDGASGPGDGGAAGSAGGLGEDGGGSAGGGAGGGGATATEGGAGGAGGSGDLANGAGGGSGALGVGGAGGNGFDFGGSGGGGGGGYYGGGGAGSGAEATDGPSTTVGAGGGGGGGSSYAPGGTTGVASDGTPASVTLTFDTPTAPTITSVDHATFGVGEESTFTATAVGLPTPTLSETGALPNGLSFTDNGDGTATLSGTPAASSAGTYPLTIGASDGVLPNASQSFTLTVGSGLHVATVSPLSGVAGTNVTITGTGLDTVTEVDFTGAAAPATIVSTTATKLVVGVPSDATTGQIVLKNDIGQAKTPSNFKPIPKIASLSAYDGAPNNEISIDGTNLAGASAVTFGTAPATTVSVTATEIVAHVPATGFSSGKVSVTSPGGTGSSSQPFAITKITGFSPTAAVSGTTVTIAGQGLASTTSVDFVNHSAATMVGTPTATSVKVVVPDDAAVGDIFVNTSNTPSDSVTSPTAFKPLPSIAQLDPPDGEIGTTVHITGANFVNVGAVKFGTLDGTNVSVVSANEVDADVPLGFAGGSVSVQTLAGTVVSKAKFTLSRVTGFSPAAAASGSTITITGQGLGDVSLVDFTGHAGVVPASTSGTSVKVVVPADAIPGRLTLHTPATDPGGFLTTTPLKVIPAITNVTPLDGAAGTAVTITGSGFFTDAATTVKFGTIVQPAFTVHSTGEIDTTIPAGFTSGKITVTTPGGGTAVSTMAVTITKVTGFSPVKATDGSTVTVTGQGLASTNEVDFTGLLGAQVPATIVSATPTAVKVTVPQSFLTPVLAGPITIHTPNAAITTTQSFAPLPTIAPLTATRASLPLSISGSGFKPTGVAPTVTLGTASVLVLFASDGAALVILPPNAISGTITVTTPEGSATAKLLVPPTISSGPSPGEGAAGTQVTLSGLTFTGTTKVTFSNNVSVPFTLTPGLTQTLTFNVPTGAVSGPITVTNAGGSTTSSAFTVNPRITSFTPVSGAVGATITVNGTGFGGADLVTFGGGATAVPTNVTATSLKVVVPQGISAGALVVHTAAGDSPASSASFSPTLTISSFSPAGGAVGSSVVIHGAGFSAATVADVKFGSTSVGGHGHFTVASPTEIDTTVPAEVTDGAITVVRTVAPNLVSAASFSILSVSGLSASSVHVGDSLTITGAHLAAVSKVTFGGSVDATPTAVTDTSVTVTVPDGVSTGTLTVKSDTFGTVTTPSVTILPPQLEEGNLGVDNESSGSVLSIYGAGLVGATAVTIGGVDVTADITGDIPDEIDLRIPPGNAGGDVVVTTDEGTSGETVTLFAHSNGLGQTYYDGLPLSSFYESEALAASFVWGETSWSAITCGSEDAIQASDGTNYATWVYGSGPLQGFVVFAATPTCPTTSDSPWN